MCYNLLKKGKKVKMAEQQSKVRIRPITKDDTPLIVAWRNNPVVKHQFVFQQTFTEELHNSWLKNEVDTGRVAQFIIETTADSRAVGSVYLRDIDRVHSKAEYGIFIGDIGDMGRGYGPGATELILRYAFEELCLNKVFLRVFADNLRAINSYKRCGFIIEGSFAQDVRIEGRYRDMIFMAKFNEER